MKSEDAYLKLEKELKRLDRLGSIAGLLEWDEQVNLPSGSADYRAEQMAQISALVHRESTRPEIGDWIQSCESSLDDLTPDQRVVVRHARKDYDRETKLPESFVARRSEARSRAYHAWTQAREASDFKGFQPHLEEQIRLANEEAGYLGCESNPYDYWLDRFDPGLDAQTVRTLFEPLKRELPGLVRQILEAKAQTGEGLFRGFAEDKQERFLRSVIEALGYDMSRGRLDRSVHPFCCGNGFDTRITTRFFPDNPLDSLFSSIHETGHALYEQGLPKEHIGTALGEAVGMAIHESQSRLWENQIGRSRAFWRYWEPKYRETFGAELSGISSDDLYRSINAVQLNPIRVDSDEVTYNLHILLRFELEQRLFQGTLAVSDLPEAWNALSRELLGLTPKNDREGVLQDVHWSGGGFGYFPSYCLGNMIAAQLWHRLKEQMPDVESRIEKGEFHGILEWLRTNVHAHGKRYDTRELTLRATGKELSSDGLLLYLKERYFVGRNQ